MNSLSPKKQDDEIAIHNTQIILTESQHYNATDKISNCFNPRVKPSFILSDLYPPKNASQIICPQVSTTKQNTFMRKFIPYAYNTDNIINEINIPDHLSFANEIDKELQGDATTNKNNKSHLFHGKQVVCCVCSVKITR